MSTENLPRFKIEMHELKQACSNCHVREICMPIGATPELLIKLDEMLFVRRRLKSGTALYHAGSHFNAIYAVKSGFMKTETLNEDGGLHVTGFYMMGEVFGFDGIATDHHMCSAMALEDTEVCIIPLNRVENAGHEFDQLQHHFYKLMSREIVRDHTIMMVLGSMHGEDRLAAFVLNLSQRFYERGYSASNFVLRMKREEIGCYLGLQPETVSRIFRKFQNLGLLDIHQRNVSILDMPGLRKMIGHPVTS